LLKNQPKNYLQFSINHRGKRQEEIVIFLLLLIYRFPSRKYDLRFLIFEPAGFFPYAEAILDEEIYLSVEIITL